ncbi:MAG TPA: AAA family ATPase [Sphaerochaeta sp.]|jgi:predicted ATPase|nr:AAA family ATPase [Sphaerochaeta sp.]
MKGALDKLTVKGFKSIKELNEFKLNDLNVIIGANGAGKSNFIQIFRMLMAMTQRNLNKFILERGGADNFLFNGPKVTPKITMEFEFASLREKVQNANAYKFELTPTADEKFLISEERKKSKTDWKSYGTPSEESRLYNENDKNSCEDQGNKDDHCIYEFIAKWVVYHFHDTSATAPMRRSEIVEDNLKLRGDAANIAPFLLHLKKSKSYFEHYTRIVNAIRLVIPFFDDFRLDVQKLGDAEKVKLSWNQKGSDFPMQPYHLSDGSIRFICLATALLQPNPPPIIIIDEPELGLHPTAIVIIAELIQAAAKQTQIIVATQSPALIDQFEIEDIIVVNHEKGASTFQRLKEEDFLIWLEEYSVGELWTKNLISAGPVYE